MKVHEITNEDCERLIKTNPEWLCKYAPMWVTHHYLDLMLKYNASWLVNTADCHFLIKHRPEIMYAHRPEFMVKMHTDWVVQTHIEDMVRKYPETLFEYSPSTMATLNPTWVMNMHPAWMIEYRAEWVKAHHPDIYEIYRGSPDVPKELVVFLNK